MTLRKAGTVGGERLFEDAVIGYEFWVLSFGLMAYVY